MILWISVFTICEHAIVLIYIKYSCNLTPRLGREARQKGGFRYEGE